VGTGKCPGVRGLFVTVDARCAEDEDSYSGHALIVSRRDRGSRGVVGVTVSLESCECSPCFDLESWLLDNAPWVVTLTVWRRFSFYSSR
jgi:hypothetical protein